MNDFFWIKVLEMVQINENQILWIISFHHVKQINCFDKKVFMCF